MIRDLLKFDFCSVLPGIFQAAPNLTISGGKLVLNTSGSAYGQLVYDAQGTWIVNTRVNVSLLNNSAGVFSLYDGVTSQCALIVKPNGKLQFIRGDVLGSTLVGPESTVALVLDNDATYYDIEAKIVIGATGTVECRVNGATVIPSTVVNNRNTANNTADVVRLLLGPNGGTVTMRMTQAIIADGQGSTDNNFFGIKNLTTLFPNRDDFNAGAVRTGTNSGSDFGQINEATPNGDTNALDADIDGVFACGFQNLPANVTSVLAVAPWWNARRTDAALINSAPALRIAGTNYLGAAQPLGPTFQYFRQAFPLSPATGVRFTPGEIDALAGGGKVST